MIAAQRCYATLIHPRAGARSLAPFYNDIAPTAEALRGMLRGRDEDVLPSTRIASFHAAYLTMDQKGRTEFLHDLGRNFAPSPSEAATACRRFLERNERQQHKSTTLIKSTNFVNAFGQLRSDLSPLYEKIFRKLGESEGGVSFLVSLRADLMGALRLQKPVDAHLKALEASLKSQLQGWFSTGVLQLERITFSESSGAMLEKIARYEAVHPVTSLKDLKQRLGSGRRCFAFTHPSLPGEPLIFVHVALLSEVACCMSDLEAAGGQPDSAARAAIFYSISSTQAGLRGVQLGNQLLKRVVARIRGELPDIGIFCTLSPLPRFRAWVQTTVIQEARRRQMLGVGGRDSPPQPFLTEEEGKMISALMNASTATSEDPSLALLYLLDTPWCSRPAGDLAILKPILTRLVARYLAVERHRGRLVCPVAHFHVSNGARIHRINWMADTSQQGMKASAGFMINYMYDVASPKIESNSLEYITSGRVPIANGITSLVSSSSPSDGK